MLAATHVRLLVAACTIAGASAVARTRTCGDEIYVSWHGGGAKDGLEYALVSPVKDTTTATAPRLFKDAEAYCARLGGGAHLGSILDANEKQRINSAFQAFPFFTELKQVWVGLSNLNPRTGSPSDDWYWTDGRPFDIANDFTEWADEKKWSKGPKASEPSCVYVDTVNDYKWTVANCDTKKLPEMLCERYEDKCASAANVCADKSSCVNQLNGDLYCACKDAEQISDTSGKTCEACTGGSCTFKVGPASKSKQTSVIVRTKMLPNDRMIRDTGIQVQISMLKHSGSAGCPRVSDSLIVRHVDGHSGEYTQCWSDSNKELVFDLKTPCSNGDVKGLKDTTRLMKAGNPCAGKVGGRIELVATEVVERGELTVVNPMLSLSNTAPPGDIKCYQCGDADWVVAENGLEYHLLDDGTERTFIEAEQKCRKLGGGAHLGSITDEGEKYALNRAFAGKIKDLTKVWFGLTNFDQYSKTVIKTGLFWTDGQVFNDEGQDKWWFWEAGKPPATSEERCTYVDTKNDFKWGVADCQSETKPSAICERFEDACTATTSAFAGSGGCSGNAICLNQMNGQYYCSCPTGQQLGPWVDNVGAHECVSCNGGPCSFQMEGHGGASSSTAQAHQESQVLRHVKIQSDHGVQSLEYTATVTVPDGSPCPTSPYSLSVRHVDAYSGEYTVCVTPGKSILDFTVDLREEMCASARGEGKKVNMKATASNSCIGKVGGRFELVGAAYGANEKLTVVNPELIHTLSDGPVPDTCANPPAPSVDPPAKKKTGTVVVLVLLVLVLFVGGVYALKGHYGRPTVHYSIQVNDDDDDDLDGLDGL